MKRTRIALITIAAALLIASGGCKKKVPVATPPPPPPPPIVKEVPKPAVINSFTAEPSTIVRGDSSTLRWSVSDAMGVTIDNGIGAVPASGSRTVSPGETTTYRLTANGKGGDAVSAVSVNVTNPPPPPPPPPVVKKSLDQRLAEEVADIYFDYDKSEVREDARAVLQKDADTIKAILADFPSAVLSLEGHCDERGSAEYNLGLGDRRSTSAKEFLAQIGVPADRLKTISFGKERPGCTEATEGCWQKNRRVHFAGAQ